MFWAWSPDRSVLLGSVCDIITKKIISELRFQGCVKTMYIRYNRKLRVMLIIFPQFWHCYLPFTMLASKLRFVILVIISGLPKPNVTVCFLFRVQWEREKKKLQFISSLRSLIYLGVSYGLTNNWTFCDFVMKIEEVRCEACEWMDSDQATNNFYHNGVFKNDSY